MRLFIIALAILGLMIIGVTGTDLPQKTPMVNHYYYSTVLVEADMGHGSGVIIADNVVLTAAHVAEIPTDLYIVTAMGERSKVTKRILDEENDLAILISEVNEPSIAKINLNHPVLGDDVYMCGTPLLIELFNSLTKGIVSHPDRDADLFQVDCFGAPGNSGGPVFCDGYLIGICVMGYSRSGSSFVLCEKIRNLDKILLKLAP